jgi:hypothetical protein
LFSPLLDDAVISEWDSWWKSVDEAVGEAPAIPKTPKRRYPFAQKLKKARRKVCALAVNAPPVFQPCDSSSFCGKSLAPAQPVVTTTFAERFAPFQ